jgi:hypothetical protein
MAAAGVIVRRFGAEEHAFLIRVPEWRDLEKKLDVGIGVIAARLAPFVQLINLPGGVGGYPGGMMAAISAGLLGSARVDDVREVLVQGLIGGGMSSTEAGALVAFVFDEEVRRGRGPMMRWAQLAFDLCMACIMGLEDEPIQAGEPEGAAKKTRARRSRTARRALPTSTPAAL